MIAQRYEAIKNNILHPELKLLMQGFANAEETFSTYQGKQDYDNHMVLLARSYPDTNSIEVITFMSSGKPTKKARTKKVKTIGITTKSTNQVTVDEDCPDCPKTEGNERSTVPPIDIIAVKKVTDDNPFVEKKEEPKGEPEVKKEETGSKLEVTEVKKVSKSKLKEETNPKDAPKVEAKTETKVVPKDAPKDETKDAPKVEAKTETKVVDGTSLSAATIIYAAAKHLEKNQPEEEEKEEPTLNPDSPESIAEFFGSKKKMVEYGKNLGLKFSNSMNALEVSTRIYDFLK